MVYSQSFAHRLAMALSRKVSTMPQRTIQIPADVVIIDAITKEPIGVTLTFRFFMEGVFKNPSWNETWKNILAQKSISEALDKAEESKASVMTISEEDWALAEKCIQNPRATDDVTGEVKPGFGFKAQFARQLSTMGEAIIKAERI